MFVICFSNDIYAKYDEVLYIRFGKGRYCGRVYIQEGEVM